MNVERLEIPILGNFGEIKMCVYPASNNAVLFEEEDAVDYGESRWQLQEGCTYEYELVAGDGRKYQFMNEDEIVRFSHSPRHPNAGTLKTGIYVGSLTLAIRDTELDCEIAKVNLEIKSIKAEYRTDYRKMLEDICGEIDDGDYEKLSDDDFDEDGEPEYDGVMYDVTCPSCGQEISFDEETLAAGSITCPGCGEVLEFDLSDEEE